MFSIFKKQEKREIKMPAHLSRADQKEIREIIKRAETRWVMESTWVRPIIS